ncbi:hypothetical protein [Streptomyces sp. BH104]|uniref:hypothetical protein n=1 Tax=Streptomyces sp. BH104 TaxID=3410407 RepID=UPI003BB48E5B
MLTSLLPGFRHLRTPFTLGVICAFQFWVLLGDRVPGHSQAQGLLARIYDLGDVAGRAAVTAAISFLLYMIGDIVRLSSVQMMSILERLNLPRISPHRVSTLSALSRYELNEFALRAFEKRSATASPQDVADLVQRIIREFTEIRMRLIANHLDVYLEHDRFDAEADFRMNVGFYTVPLWPILAWCWAPWFLLGVLASMVIFVNGLRARREANEILVQAIVSGIAQSRFYDEEVGRDFDRSASNVTIRRRPSTR